YHLYPPIITGLEVKIPFTGIVFDTYPVYDYLILHPKISVMKKLSSIFAIILAFSSIQAATFNVTVLNNHFSPPTLTIHRGDSVTWTNNAGTHNVDEDNAYFFSGAPASGWTYSFEFDTIGTFNYHCDVHGSMGMTGSITVLEAGVGV